MDRLSSEHRSWNMSRIRCSDTAPERAVRSILHRLGFRFRKASSSSLPGRPDVVLPSRKAVVFVHGCFWHRHKRCKFAYEPKSNHAFWKQKFEANKRRDAKVRKMLLKLGWRIVVVWECELSRVETIKRRLLQELS
jgi:DNA mismatch endonuclease (patch repair protein)